MKAEAMRLRLIASGELISSRRGRCSRSFRIEFQKDVETLQYDPLIGRHPCSQEMPGGRVEGWYQVSFITEDKVTENSSNRFILSPKRKN